MFGVPLRLVIRTAGYAASHSFMGLKPLEFEREEAKHKEVEIELLFRGVCHSDIHQMKNERHNMVPAAKSPNGSGGGSFGAAHAGEQNTSGGYRNPIGGSLISSIALAA